MNFFNLSKIIFIFLLSSFSVYAQKLNIALCIMATGKYINYAEQLVKSAKKYFLKNHNITYLIFTDSNKTNKKNKIYIFQKRLGWPYDTMNRFHSYDDSKKILQQFDYIYATDADMLFVSNVGDEILGDLVGVRHPGFINSNRRSYSYEVNSNSLACIKNDEGEFYFAGGFYGAKKENFLNLISQCRKNVDEDLKKGIIAVWHDESHLNRYFIDHKPNVILSPSYCYPENWKMPYEKKLLALDKNHSEMRK